MFTARHGLGERNSSISKCKYGINTRGTCSTKAALKTMITSLVKSFLASFPTLSPIACSTFAQNESASASLTCFSTVLIVTDREFKIVVSRRCLWSSPRLSRREYADSGCMVESLSSNGLGVHRPIHPSAHRDFERLMHYRHGQVLILMRCARPAVHKTVEALAQGQ